MVYYNQNGPEAISKSWIASMKAKILCLCLISLSAASYAYAVKAETHYDEINMLGLGTSSCGDYIAASQGSKIGSYAMMKHEGQEFSQEKKAYLEWARGYLTAMNSEYVSMQIEIGTNALEVSINNFCNANPTSFFLNAVSNVFYSNMKKTCQHNDRRVCLFNYLKESLDRSPPSK